MPKIIPAVAAGATALAVAGGTFSYAALNKDVTLSVDGAASTVSTRSATVGEVLQKEGIAVGPHDVVAPAVDAAVSDGSRIAVQFGRQVTVTVDGRPQTLWTTARRVDQALGALSVNTTGAAISTSRSAPIGRAGLALDVATLKTVTIDAAGREKQLKTTARTAAEALRVARIQVDADDKLNVRPTAKLTNGAKVAYTKVDVQVVTKTENVAYQTVTRRTSTLKKGDTKVDTPGRTGERTVTYRKTMHNGKAVQTKKTGSKITDQPQTKVVLVGTKVVKKKAVKRATVKRSTKSFSSDSSPRVASGSVWDKLAKCESGGNWSINTGNGFYGGLQFTRSTWRAYGGSGMPHHASRSRQIAVAKKVKAGQGWGAWPACTSKLGLR